jgi:hypothetical protein
MRKNLLIVAAVFFALLVGGFYFVYHFTYSEGNRAGVVLKFSRKGYIFKTYEGELNMGGMNTIITTAQSNQIWLFSVKDKRVADSLMKLEGKKVSLHYAEKLGNLPWDGETKYFVDAYTIINH